MRRFLIFALVLCVTSCSPALAAQTPTVEPSVTLVPQTATLSPTATSTPNPHEGVDFNDPSTFPAELRNYQPGQSVEMDKKYHVFVSRVLIEKFSDNPDFLEKYDIDIDGLKKLTDADLQNYDTYFSQVFLPTLVMNAENYQISGEYESLPFDQWMVEKMYKINNYVPSCNVNGKITYGFRYNRPIDTDKLSETIIKYRESLPDFLENNQDIHFVTNINGRLIDTNRGILQGEAKFINLGYMDLPGYPNVKIMIGGAFDENGKLVAQPFVVNSDRTSLPNGEVWMPTRTRASTVDDYKKYYDEMSWDMNELLATIGHVVIITPNQSYVLTSDVPLEELTIENFKSPSPSDLVFLGFEAVSKMNDEGLAPEFPDLLSPSVPTATVTVTPPAPTPTP
ncbi:MAG: hypothetical protein FD146_1809 [Anaerolineaceae bacterium]|nr:MAG: hypothetical protein FD146_1809 [Anaerolineaceae bacterium]